MMADDESTEPQTPDGAPEGAEPTGEGGEQSQHAVPSEEAQEIAGSAEDTALEAAQEAIDAGGETPPEPATVQPGGEGHSGPSEEALEIAGVAQEAPLEAGAGAAPQTPAQ